MDLFLVRHGQCGTSSVDSELTPLGEQQARLTGQRLATQGVTHLLSSPLLRALGTASIIAEELHELPIEVWLDLREGLSTMLYRASGREELQERFPRAVLPQEIADDGWDHGNDTYESLFARCEAVLQRLKERFSEQDRVVVVSHGGTINYLLHCILQISSTTPRWFDVNNCGICRVHFVPERRRRNWPLYPPVQVEIWSINDTSHLHGSDTAQ